MQSRLEILLSCIDLEEKEQANRFKLDQQHSLKQLKAEGLALHPLIITRKNFGYADYPEISFRLAFPLEANLFKDGAAIECFKSGEEPIKAVLLQLDGKNGEFRLFAPDFPDWIEDHDVGIKLSPDTRTSSIMKKTLNELPNQPHLLKIFQQLHSNVAAEKNSVSSSPPPSHFHNKNLNKSQQQAVAGIIEGKELTIVHGPPGTGKTTTVVEAILHLIERNEKVLVSAPSNTAVDKIAKDLIDKNVRLLRVGNSSKVDATIFAHTPEGRLNNSKTQKDIKQLKMRAEEFRRMALKYKRSFGKAEREQRNLLFKEVKSIRAEIKKLQQYNEEKLFAEAQVIAGTPIGIYDAGISKLHFETLIMDEAGQCIEPLAWCIFPFAEKIVLAGDHLQLSPTVLSHEAMQKGFNKSILEIAAETIPDIFLLNVQYRMKDAIAGFSNEYFYKGLLQSADGLANTGEHLVFIDTAGSSFNEKSGPDSVSLQNEGELEIVQALLATKQFLPQQTAFISPYSGQVAAARELLPAEMRISTIDSFQGQEKENIILSLVRSNDDGDIGFLKDYRRMNVAITRAKEQLVVIGDSATLGADNFYSQFLSYVEKHGTYKTVWEFDLMH